MLSFIIKRLFLSKWQNLENKSKFKKVNKLIESDLKKIQEKYGNQYQMVFFGYDQNVSFSQNIKLISILLIIISLLFVAVGSGILLIFTIPLIIIFNLTKKILKNKMGVLLYCPEKMYLIKGKNEVPFHLNQIKQLELSMSKGLVFIMETNQKLFLSCGGPGYVEFLTYLESEYSYLIDTIPEKKYIEHKNYMLKIQSEVVAI